MPCPCQLKNETARLGICIQIRVTLEMRAWRRLEWNKMQLRPNSILFSSIRGIDIGVKVIRNKMKSISKPHQSILQFLRSKERQFTLLQRPLACV